MRLHVFGLLAASVRIHVARAQDADFEKIAQRPVDIVLRITNSKIYKGDYRASGLSGFCGNLTMGRRNVQRRSPCSFPTMGNSRFGTWTSMLRSCRLALRRSASEFRSASRPPRARNRRHLCCVPTSRSSTNADRHRLKWMARRRSSRSQVPIPWGSPCSSQSYAGRRRSSDGWRMQEGVDGPVRPENASGGRASLHNPFSLDGNRCRNQRRTAPKPRSSHKARRPGVRPCRQRPATIPWVSPETGARWKPTLSARSPIIVGAQSHTVDPSRRSGPGFRHASSSSGSVATVDYCAWIFQPYVRLLSGPSPGISYVPLSVFPSALTGRLSVPVIHQLNAPFRDDRTDWSLHW